MTNKAQAERSPEESSPLSVDGIWTPLGQVLINECDHLFQYSGDPGRWPLRCCIACGAAAIAAALRAAEQRGRERGIEEAAREVEVGADGLDKDVAWQHGDLGVVHHLQGRQAVLREVARRIRALLASAAPQPEEKGAGQEARVVSSRDTFMGIPMKVIYAGHVAKEQPTAGPSDPSSAAAAETPEET